MVGLPDFLSVDTFLALLSILIGVTIFLMQRRADSKINDIISTQFRRQELEKKYFGTRLMSNLRLVRKSSLKLQQYLGEYLNDHSQANKGKVKNFCAFQITNLDDYLVPSLRSDLGRLIEFIDDIELVDRLTSGFDGFSSVFKDCSVDSAFEDSDLYLREKITSTQEQSDLIDSFLSKLDREIPTID
jgi:hypothetical protein